MKENSVLKFEIDSTIIRVVMNGFWQDENKEGSPMHEHAAFEIHTLMLGAAEIETEKETILLEENDTVLIPPEMFHRFKNQEKGSVVVSFTFFVDKKRKSQNFEFIENSLKNLKNPILFLKNQQIKESLGKIVSNIYSRQPFSTDCIRAQFVLLFAEVFSELINKESSSEAHGNEETENDARVFMIEEYFNEFYMEQVSLKKLSKLLNLSERQTDRMIKKAFGVGFRQQLCKIRMMNAKKLLTDSNMEVAKIAEVCGYGSYNGFYLAFKEKTKMTPVQYREAFRNK